MVFKYKETDMVSIKGWKKIFQAKKKKMAVTQNILEDLSTLPETNVSISSG